MEDGDDGVVREQVSHYHTAVCRQCVLLLPLLLLLPRPLPQTLACVLLFIAGSLASNQPHNYPANVTYCPPARPSSLQRRRHTQHDRHLPVANIARIMKRSLPGSAKIAKDAKDAMQECVSEFIGFITSE